MRILIIDDDHDSLEAVSGFLLDPLGYDVSTADNCTQALEIYKKDPFPIVISDIKMPGMNGIELLKKIKELPGGIETDVILMTGFGELETCIEALREGATDYILKPIYVHQLDLILKRILEKKELKRALSELNEKYDHEIKHTNEIKIELERFKRIYSDIIEGEDIGIFSEKMKSIVDLCLKLHDNPELPVLIEGETGTGKEIIARLIHKGDKKAAKPFITINCSAISPTLFESELFGYERGAFTGAKSEGSIGKLELAQGGTIFLDEIGDMPLEMQPKLLRAIQQKEIYRIGGKKCINLNIRFICATNQYLKDKVEKKLFREDLYYRINSGYVHVPPLKERKSEIAPLARMMLDKVCREKNRMFESIDRDAVFLMENYNWPGNIRELKNTIERVCLLQDDKILKPEHLFFLEASKFETSDKKLIIDLSAEKFPLKEIEYLITRKVHKIFEGNINKAAKFLNIAWATFVKMARLK